MDPPLNTMKHHVLSPLNTAQLGDLAETGGSFCFFRNSWTPRSETFLGATANWALKDLWNNVIQLIFIQTIYIMYVHVYTYIWLCMYIYIYVCMYFNSSALFAANPRQNPGKRFGVFKLLSTGTWAARRQGTWSSKVRTARHEFVCLTAKFRNPWKK